MISYEEAQELHLKVGGPLEVARENGTFNPEYVTVRADELERAREIAALLVSDSDPDNQEPRGITLTRDQLEAWAGRSLTDDDVEALDDAIPNSGIPESIGTIADSLSI